MTAILRIVPVTFLVDKLKDPDYDDELWYANVRVTRKTVDFGLNAAKNDLFHEDTVVRLAISAKRTTTVASCNYIVLFCINSGVQNY